MKTIYKSILERLKTINKLKWIDLDTGQLDSRDRPQVAFPAALITIEVPSCVDLTEKSQSCTARITLRLAFNANMRTSSGTAENVLNNSLTIYDDIADIYTSLQGFETQYFSALHRLSQNKENRNDGLFIYRLVFQCEYEDTSAE